MQIETMTDAARATARSEVGGFNSRPLEDALAAPRPWKDVYPLITHSDTLIVELWEGPHGDKLIRYQDQSYIYFFGCSGGVGHFDDPMTLAFAMPSIAAEVEEWTLVFDRDCDPGDESVLSNGK